MPNLDLAGLREGSRLEAKLAKGGLPRNVWESYSAFANTEGGTILLGVEEEPDGTLVPIGVENPRRMLDDFWNAVNNPQRVSANVLMDDGVQAIEVDGATIIRIDVPRADRHVRPVFAGNNPLTGTYRRNHAGDYRCSYEQVQAMMRDAADRGQDARVVEEARLDELDRDTVRRYRAMYNQSHERHPWAAIEDEAFLCKIGAAARGSDGEVHPTGAGLLLFGQDWVITREFPHYFLDYRRQTDPANRWNDRFVSSGGDWSGNLIDFYDRAYNKLKQALDVPFQMEGIYRVDDTPAHRALREALANCITNADFYGRQGVVCLWEADAIRIANPGTFRVDVDAAIAGGITDPRNETMMRILSYIDIGERAGSGLPKIYGGWLESGYDLPRIEQSFDPERTTLVLPLRKREPSDFASEVDGKTSREDARGNNKREDAAVGGNNKEKTGINNEVKDNNKGINNASTVDDEGKARRITSKRNEVLELMLQNPTITQEEIATQLGITRSAVQKRITALQRLDIVRREGSRKSGRWVVTPSISNGVSGDGDDANG